MYHCNKYDFRMICWSVFSLHFTFFFSLIMYICVFIYIKNFPKTLWNMSRQAICGIPRLYSEVQCKVLVSQTLIVLGIVILQVWLNWIYSAIQTFCVEPHQIFVIYDTCIMVVVSIFGRTSVWPIDLLWPKISFMILDPSHLYDGCSRHFRPQHSAAAP